MFQGIRWILFFFFYAVGIISALGQVTKVMGVVTEEQTGVPIPFVNVYYKGTNIGVTTDFDGKYSIETKHATDTLIASFVGYNSSAVPVVHGKFQYVNFQLQPSQITLKEVVIRPGENPAEVLLKKVRENRDRNDKRNFDAYEYEVYNKIQFDANNISEKFKNKRLLKPFRFIFDNIDTSTVNGKVYLPIFLSESVSDVFYRKNPKAKIEKIKASKVSGIDNESVSQFLGEMVQNVNIYKNHVPLFGKNFISPLSAFGLNYYRYYLVDSTYIGNDWCYEVKFKPRRKQEFTFTGNFWVHDTTYAIRQFKMRIVDDVNINFIDDLVLEQHFEEVDSHWILVKDKMIADFNIVEEAKSAMGFFGTKTTTYRNFVFNQPRESAFYKSPTDVIVEESAHEKEDEYWKTHRHEALTKDEKTIYHMIDTLKSIPVFNTYVDVVKMVVSGYYENGLFEYGPYMSTYSFNDVEGNRFRLGLRTSNSFSKKMMFSGHLAYGLKDHNFKYGGGLLYMLNKNPRRTLSAHYHFDVQQLGASQNAFREDFLLASLFRRNPANRLSLVQTVDMSYEHEWFSGFSNTISFHHQELHPVKGEPYLIYQAFNDTYSSCDLLTTAEIGLKTRFAYKEKYVLGEFERVSLGAEYPIVEMLYGYGIPDLFHGQFEYHKLQLNIKHWFNVGALGWSKYQIEGGRIWGRLPYPLLKIQAGNETYWFDESAFNLMNYYEFVSDKYISGYYTHHFSGLFLNRIPLMRKLKWREVVFVKGVIGSVDKNNMKYAAFPSDVHSLDKPYVEMGVGVENIFKFLRFDGIWRLSHLENEGATPFGLRISMVFDF